jgi:hypothetical protein
MAVTQRPEALGAVAQTNPRLAQELIQRQVDQEVTRASRNTGERVPLANKGIALENALKDKGVMANLDYLFPGNPAAAADFKTKLEVAANASKPRGPLSGVDPGPTSLGVQEVGKTAARASLGMVPYIVGGLARAIASPYRRLSDNQLIAVLQKPDVIERLAALSQVPAPRLTQAAFMAAVPQLFEEPSK